MAESWWESTDRSTRSTRCGGPRDEAQLRGCALQVVGSFTTPIMSTGYEVAVPDPADLAGRRRHDAGAAIDTVRDEGALDGVDIDRGRSRATPGSG